jgi:hypothetical protein
MAILIRHLWQIKIAETCSLLVAVSYSRIKVVFFWDLDFLYTFLWTTKRLENQPNQGCMTEAMQQLGEMRRHVNPSAESYSWMHQIIWNVWLNA